MTRYYSTEYIMEDPREALRLEKKVEPREWLKKYLDLYIYPHAEVLSVGCGPGTILGTISDMDPTVRTTGIDISATRIRQARERNPNSPVRFVCGDAQDMQFPSHSFDLVYTRMLLQYLPQKEQAVSEMVRVCRPGGVVLMQDLDGQLVWHYPVDSLLQNAVEKVMAALSETGFDPFVGRKLFWLAQKAGLRNIEVKAECYHMIAGQIDPLILEQWQLKLEVARPCMVSALGSEHEAETQIRRFLEYLNRPDTMTYSNVFTVTGEKPL